MSDFVTSGQGVRKGAADAGGARGASGGAAPGQLPAGEVAAFCEGLAAMLAAGIQIDEGLALLSEGATGTPLEAACAALWNRVCAGGRLSDAMAEAGIFPAHATLMVAAGERAGRTEATLRSLAVYYGEEDRVMAKLRTAVGYPAALLCVMSVVLAFTVAVILPVFIGVYEDMAGSLTAGSSLAVGASVAIGWVALAVCLVATVCTLGAAAMSRSVRGQATLMRLMRHLPFTRGAVRTLALSRFMGGLATCLSAGSNVDVAMSEALEGVEDAGLRAQLEPALASMEDVGQGLGLAQALAESGVLEPAHARMLVIGSRSGSVDEVLEQLSEVFFEDAVSSLDGVLDAVEPLLAALLTLAVGATLVAVMLPLIGMMGSVG